MILIDHWVGYVSLALFGVAYSLVIAEEFTHLRKSKPVILAAGLIWFVIALQYAQIDKSAAVEEAVLHFLTEFSQLFLFLLAAMTYVNAMTERNVFDVLRAWLVHRRFSLRTVFWVTGICAFFLSPVIDNLTTSLVMGAVILAIARGNNKFIGLACINIVVAANAGGAFSPFGDITTLMVWQRGIVPFADFFALLLPSAVNFLVPAILMSFTIKNVPSAPDAAPVQLKRGGLVIVGLFACTILTAVCFYNFLHLPPFLGMMTGLAYLQFFGYYLRITHVKTSAPYDPRMIGDPAAFDGYREIARVEWDTLLFFFGVIMCVGGLGFIGYLDSVSAHFYANLGPTVANILVGGFSAVVDNIPIMVAVLEMNPNMDMQQWLLVTLTAGVGGSLLSIGSAAGVALMGQARGAYTFFTHLKWTPAILVGYLLSVWLHLTINDAYRGVMPWQ